MDLLQKILNYAKYKTLDPKDAYCQNCNKELHKIGAIYNPRSKRIYCPKDNLECYNHGMIIERLEGIIKNNIAPNYLFPYQLQKKIKRNEVTYDKKRT